MLQPNCEAVVWKSTESVPLYQPGSLTYVGFHTSLLRILTNIRLYQECLQGKGICPLARLAHKTSLLTSTICLLFMASSSRNWVFNARNIIGWWLLDVVLNFDLIWLKFSYGKRNKTKKLLRTSQLYNNETFTFWYDKLKSSKHLKWV